MAAPGNLASPGMRIVGGLIDVAEIELCVGETFEVPSQEGRIVLRPGESNATAEDLECTPRITLRECKQAAAVAQVDRQSLKRRVAQKGNGLVVHLAGEHKLTGSFVHEPGAVEGPCKQL